MKCHVFDVSNYLYAGGFYSRRQVSSLIKESNGAYRSANLDVGSVAYILNEYIRYADSGDDLVFVFDNTPTVKREMYARAFGNPYGYKAGRNEKPKWFNPCKHMAEEVLRQIGANVLSREGYEADDLIASFIKYHRNSYEHIYIHTRDSDLIHLVSPTVTIEMCNKAGKHVDVNNYPESVKKNFNVHYNTAIISRLCFNMKDNVPLIPKEWRDVINKGIPKDVWPNCGNTRLLRSWIERLTDKNELVLNTYDIVVPILLPGEDVELYDLEPDRELMEYYFWKFGCIGNYVATNSEVGSETIDKYVEEYIEEGGY